ncbi:hypothetical protein D3C83_308200 [compost metagenome]
MFQSGGEQVDDRTANGKLAGLENLLGRVIAGLYQLLPEIFNDDRLANLQIKTALLHIRQRWQSL